MGQWGSVSSTTSKYRVQWVPWVPLRIELCFLDCANYVLDLRWNYSFSNVCNMFLYHVIISLCIFYIMEIITYITYIYIIICLYHVIMFRTESSPCWPPAGDSSKAFAAALQQSHLQDAWIGWVDTFSVTVIFPLDQLFFQHTVFNLLLFWLWTCYGLRISEDGVGWLQSRGCVRRCWPILQRQLRHRHTDWFQRHRWVMGVSVIFRILQGTSFRWFSMELFI